MTGMLYLAFGLALVASLLLTPAVGWLAKRAGMLDHPDPRKVHKTPTPRIGGIAIVLGTLIASGTVLGILAARGQIIPPELVGKLIALLAAGCFVFAVGLVDDIRSVSGRFKFISMLFAGGMLCGSGAVWGDMVFGGDRLVEFRWLSWLATMLWITYF